METFFLSHNKSLSTTINGIRFKMWQVICISV